MDNQTSGRPRGYTPSAISGTEPYVHNSPGMVENMGLRLQASTERLLAGAITAGATLAGVIEPDEGGNLAERAAANANEYANSIREHAEQVGGEPFVSLDTVDRRLANDDFSGLAFDVFIGSLGEIVANSPEFIGMVAKNKATMGAAVLSYGTNLAMDRAKNDGRDTVSREDMAAGIAVAAVQKYLTAAEVALPKNIFFGKGSQAAKSAAAAKKGSVLRSAGAIATKGATAAGKGAGLEAVSEELDYLAAYMYTKEGVSQEGAIEAALSGALIGAGPAGAAGVFGGVRDEAQVAAMRRDLNKPEEGAIPTDQPLALPAPPSAALPPPAPGLPGPGGSGPAGVTEASLAAIWTDARLSGDARTVANAEQYIVESVGPARAKEIMAGAVTAPEAEMDLAAQVQAVDAEGYDAMGNPTGVKSAVFSEERAPLKAAIAGVDDWKIFKSKDGGFYAAPANAIAALRKVDKRLGAAGRPDILGYSAPKPAPGAPAAVVQGKNKAGATVQEQVVDPTDAAATEGAVGTAAVLGDTVAVTTPEAALTERQQKLAAETEAMNNPFVAVLDTLEGLNKKLHMFDTSLKKGKRDTFGYTGRRTPKSRKDTWIPVGKAKRAGHIEEALDAMLGPMRDAAAAGIDLAPIAKIVNPLFDFGRAENKKGTIAMGVGGDLSILEMMLSNNALLKQARGKNISNADLQPFFDGIRQAVAEVAVAKPTIEVFSESTKEAEGAAKTATGMPRTSTTATAPKKKTAKKQAAKKTTTKKTVAKKAAPKTKPTTMAEAMALALAEKKAAAEKKAKVTAKKKKTVAAAPAAKTTPAERKTGTLSLKKKTPAKAKALKEKAVAKKAAPKKKPVAAAPTERKTGTLSLKKKTVAKKTAPKKKAAAKAPVEKKKTKAELKKERIRAEMEQGAADLRAKRPSVTTEKKKEGPKGAALKAKAKTKGSKPRRMSATSGDKKISEHKERTFKVLSGIGGDNVDAATRKAALVKKVPELAGLTMVQMDDLMTRVVLDIRDISDMNAGMSEPLSALREAYVLAHEQGTMAAQARALNAKARGDKPASKGYTKQAEDVAFLKENSAAYVELFDIFEKLGKESAFMAAFADTLTAGNIQPLVDFVTDAATDGLIYSDLVEGGGAHTGDGPTVTMAQVDELFNVAETIGMHTSRKGQRSATTEGARTDEEAELATMAALAEEIAQEEAAAKKEAAAERAEQESGYTDLSEDTGDVILEGNEDPNDYESMQGEYHNPVTGHLPLSKEETGVIQRVRSALRARLLDVFNAKRFTAPDGNGAHAQMTLRNLMGLLQGSLDVNDPMLALVTRLMGRGDLNPTVIFARTKDFATLTGYSEERSRSVGGLFSWSGDRSAIVMNASMMAAPDGRRFIPMLMHEVMHAFTVNMIYQAGIDTAMGKTGTDAQKFVEEVSRMRSATVEWVGKNWNTLGVPHDQLRETMYGIQSNAEFIAEAHTNKAFQKILRQVQYEKVADQKVPGDANIWESFKKAVWRALGGKNTQQYPNVLDEVLLVTAQNEQNITQEQADTYDTISLLGLSTAEVRQHDTDITTTDIGYAVLDHFGWADGNTRRDNRQNSRSRQRTSEHASNIYSHELAVAVDEFNDAVSPDGKTLPAFVKAAKKTGGKAIHLLGLATLDIIDTTYRRLFDGTGIEGGNPLQHLTKMLQARAGYAKKHERTDNYILRKLKRYQKQHPEDVAKFDALWLHANHAQVNPAYAWQAPQNRMARKGRNAARNQRVHAKLRTELQGMSGNGWVSVFKGLDKFYIEKNEETRHETMAAAMRGMGLSEATAEHAAARAVKAVTKEQVEAFTVYHTVDGEMQMHESIDDIRQAIRELNKATLRNGPQAPIMRDGTFVMRAEKSASHTVASKEAANELRAALGETMGVSFTKQKVNSNGTVTFTSTEKVFELHEKESAANKSRAAFEAEGYTTMQIVPKNAFEGMDTTGFNTILNQAKKRISSRGGKGSKEAIKSLEETLSAMVAGYQISKSSIRRRNKAGGNPDQRRTLAKFIQSHSKGIAALKYGDKVADAQDDLIASGDRIAKMDTKNAMQAGYVINEMNKRINGWRGERGTASEWAGKFGFLTHLMSFSYSLLNLTQHITTGLPYLAGKFGMGKATTAMGHAYKTVGKPVIKAVMESKLGLSAFTKDGVDLEIIIDTIIARVTDPEAKRMLQSLADGGVIDASFTMELYEASLGNPGAATEFGNKFFEMGRTLPFITEIVNRTVVSLAAFELAIDDGQSYQEARDYAEAAVRKTQFDYTEVNRPRWFVQSDLSRALTMFKLHPLGVYGMLVEQVNNIRDPKTRAEGARTLAYLLTAHGVFAGAAGAILMEPIRLAMAALGMAFDDDDEVQRILNNPEIAMRKILYETTGSKVLAQVFTEGLPTAAGIQMFNRVGLHNMMIQPAGESTGLDYSMDTFMNTILGPVFGFGDSMRKFSSSMKNGNTWARSVEYIMPKGVRDVMRAMRYNTDGMTDFNGNVIQNADQFGWDDMLIRAVGFSSVTESDTYAGRRYRTQYVTARRDHANRLRNSYHQATGSGKRNRMADIRTYNRSLSRADREEFGIPIASLLQGAARRKEKESNIHHGGEYRKSMSEAEELRMLRAP